MSRARWSVELCNLDTKEDVMPNRDELFTGNASGGMSNTWDAEEEFWRDAWTTRPYINADRGFDYYQPAFRYGYESASRLRGRDWSDVQKDLEAGWGNWEGKGEGTWEHMKEAVRDAWNRVAHAHRH
jgi:hypothetical protein